MKTFLSSACSLFALALALTGCNVFEGFYEAGTSNDPQVLITDAQQAMEQGEPEKAIPILEKAVAKATPGTPQHQTASVNLATAELQAANVSVLDLQNLMEDLNAKIDVGSGTTSGKFEGFAGQVCSYGAGDRRMEEVDLKDVRSFAAFAHQLPTFWRALQAINMAFGLTDNEYISQEQLEQIAASHHSATVRDAFSQALLIRAMSKFAIAYNEIVEAGGTEITWYRVQSAAGGYYLGYCAPSQQVIDQAKQQTACSMSKLHDMIVSLKVRATLYPGTSGFIGEVIEKAEEGYAKLETELDGVCPVSG